jgi:hypothetical protein
MTGCEASALRRRGATRRAGLLAAAGLSLLAGLPAMAASGHARHHGAPGVVTIGRFTPTLVRPGYVKAGGSQTLPYAEHLALAVDAKSRMLFTLDADPQDPPLNPTYVGAYRLATLRPAASRGSLLNGWVSTHLVDLHRGGMTVAVSAGGIYAATTAVERVVAVHGVPKTAQVTTVSLGANQVVVGLADGPRPNLVFALSVAYQSSRPAGTTFGVQQVPGSVQLSLIRLGHAGALWTHQLSNCDLPVFGAMPQLPAPVGYVAARHAVDVGCIPPPTPIASTTVPPPPIPSGVGVVSLGDRVARPRFGFALYALPGDASSTPSGVWAPHVDRLALNVTAVNGQAAFVFDGRHNAWVGSVKLSDQPPAAVGLDPVHSRFYTLTKVSSLGRYGGGLVLSDLAVTPVDVGHNFPQFETDPAPPGGGPLRDPVAVDPVTGRLFMYYADSPTFLVARDEMPHYTPPKAANPDMNTTNIAERPGVTGATYSGSAQGYGSIVRQVGGATNLVHNVVSGTPPFGPTRELSASYLDNLSIGQTGTQAGGIAAQPDNATFQQLPRQQVGARTLGGWPYPPVACHSGDPSHLGWSASGAQVTCAESAVGAAIAAGSSSASYATGAGGTSAGATSVVSVAGSTLAATSSRDSKRGVVTSVTSIARGVSILSGLLRIGEVSTTAEAHAHGRPHTAGTSFSRTLRDISLGGKPLCSTNCDPATVAEQVNTALAGHVLISFPTPDHPLAEGSPGGYQALVQRDAYSAVNERTLNDQPVNRLEVPGVEATIFEDGTQPARTVVYLAGVEAEAHYGIYRLGQPGTGSDVPANAPAGKGPGAPGAPGGPTTVTSPTGDVAGAPTLAPPTNLTGLLHHGWQLLVAGVGDVMRLLGVWLVLLAPVYLSARRWLLTRRHEVTHV